MEKKYKLTDDTIVIDGVTLHRIEALRDISPGRFGGGDVKKGDIGGYVESERNLSHSGNCWIYNDAKVMGNACVLGRAQLYAEAKMEGGTIRGDATIVGSVVIGKGVIIGGRARIADNVTIQGSVVIEGAATVYGKTVVSGTSLETTRIYGDAHVNCSTVATGARIAGNASVRGDVVVLGAVLEGTVKVFGDNILLAHGVVLQAGHIGCDANIINTRDSFVISPVGSENGTLTVYEAKDGKLRCTRGCFEGTLDEFEKAVEESHRIRNPKVYKEYQKIIELIKFKKLLDLNIEEKFKL